MICLSSGLDRYFVSYTRHLRGQIGPLLLSSKAPSDRMLFTVAAFIKTYQRQLQDVKDETGFRLNTIGIAAGHAYAAGIKVTLLPSAQHGDTL